MAEGVANEPSGPTGGGPAADVSPAPPRRTPDEVAAVMHAGDRVAHVMGMSIDEVGLGTATVSMTVRDDMTNGLGVCHGGLVFSLADTAMAHASNSGDERTLSNTATIEWLRPARSGDRLVARCESAGRRGRNVIWDVTVTGSGGERVALLRGQTLTVGGPVGRDDS